MEIKARNHCFITNIIYFCTKYMNLIYLTNFSVFSFKNDLLKSFYRPGKIESLSDEYEVSWGNVL